MEARSSSESEIVLRQMMLPSDANPFGNVHGAWLFKLAVEAAEAVAMRHCRSRVATLLVESMSFAAPVHFGDVVHVAAHMTWAGRTSPKLLP